jgi:signal transduction histidine kinase
LVAAVEWLAEDFERRTGVTCGCTARPEEIDVDPERATVVFRICQEALTNVARHAAATSVTILLEKKGELLRLDIGDNGRGIPQEKLAEAGRDRAR